MREYANDKLHRAGEAEAMAAAHATYFLEFGENAEAGLRGASRARWFGMLRADHANLRAALSWMAATDGQVDMAQRLAGSLGPLPEWELASAPSFRAVVKAPGLGLAGSAVRCTA